MLEATDFVLSQFREFSRQLLSNSRAKVSATREVSRQIQLGLLLFLAVTSGVNSQEMARGRVRLGPTTRTVVHQGEEAAIKSNIGLSGAADQVVSKISQLKQLEQNVREGQKVLEVEKEEEKENLGWKFCNCTADCMSPEGLKYHEIILTGENLGT